MDLTNIVLELSKSTFASKLDGVWYKIPTLTNEAALQTELDSEAGFTVSRAVVQYKDNLTVPRVLCSDGNDDPDLEQTADLPLSGISANLTTEIATAKTEVETEITAQTA